MRRLVRRHSPEEAEFVIEGGSHLRVEPLVNEMTELRVGLEQVTIAGENGTRSVRLVLRLPSDRGPAEIAEILANSAEVKSVDWARH